MNFEAVPCVLKNGQGTPMYGLLIRPLQSQQLVINVPPSTSVNGQQQPTAPVNSGNVFQTSSSRSDNYNFSCNRMNNGNNNSTNISTNGSLTTNNPNSNVRNNNSGRRNYQTILPRDNNALNTTTTNPAINNNNNGKTLPFFIPATAVQNFQQSRATAPVTTTNNQQQLRPAAPSLSYCSAVVGPTTFDAQGMQQNAPPPIVQQPPPPPLPQQQLQQPASGYVNFSSDVQQLQNSHLTNVNNYSTIQQQQTNFNVHNQQQQQNNSSCEQMDLEKILQGIDPNDINCLLQNFTSYDVDSDLVQVETMLGVGDASTSDNHHHNHPHHHNHQLEDLYEAGTSTSSLTPMTTTVSSSAMNNCGSSMISSQNNNNSTNDGANNNNNNNNNDDNPNNSANSQRPPCRYQGEPTRCYQQFLMNANNLRVNPSGYGSRTNDNINEYVNNNNNGGPDIASYSNNNNNNGYVRNNHVQQQQFQIVEQQHGHHESGTPDSGIQSIGESPQALPQNSPLQQIASHSPLVNAQSSPRFNFATTPFSPYLQQQQQNPNVNFKYLNNRRRLSGDLPRVMEPLSVNTGCCYEAVSDCETSPSTSGDFVNRKPQGLLATSTPKTNRDSSSDNDDFTDMPILEPEISSSSKKTTAIAKQQENETQDSIEKQTENQTQKSADIITLTSLNVVDANSVVETLLSSLPPEKLTSVSQLLEAKLKAAGFNNNEKNLNLTKKIEEISSTNSAANNLIEIRPFFNSGYVSDASSTVSPPMVMDEKIKNTRDFRRRNSNVSVKSQNNDDRRRISTEKTTTTTTDENALKKLNEYRLKMKQKLLNETVVRELNNLCEIMQLTLTATMKKQRLENRSNAFDVDWTSILDRNAAKKSQKINLTSNKTNFVDSLQNLEKEASESDVDEDSSNNLMIVNYENNEVENQKNLIAEKQQQPLKIKLRLLRNNSSNEATNSNSLGEISQSMIKMVKERRNNNQATTTTVNLPLKKRFKHRTSGDSTDDNRTLSSIFLCGDRKRRRTKILSTEKQQRKKKRLITTTTNDDGENFTTKTSKKLTEMYDLPLLSVEVEPMDVDGYESRLPTLSPQVSPKPSSDHQIVRRVHQQSLISPNSPKKKKRNNINTTNNNLLSFKSRRCRNCWTWIKVSSSGCESAPTCSSSTKKDDDYSCPKCSRSSAGTKSTRNTRKSTKIISRHPSSDDSETLLSLNNSIHDNSETNEKLFPHLLVPKKKYCKSGLYSDRRSVESPPVSPSGFSLSPVENCRNREDFCLPYDIWWEYVYQKNYVCDDPSTNFRKIRRNIYVDSKLISPSVHYQSCNCRRPSSKDNRPGCGDDCLNRLMFTECNPNSCQCGDKCSNRRFQKRQWQTGLERFDTKTKKGNGVRTTKPIPAHSFICEYLGEVVLAENFAERMRTWYKNCQHHYALNLDSGTVVDGYRCGSIARFINHSCDPNSEVQKWMVNGRYRVGIFALRDIEAGEELSYNYNFHAFNSPQKCLCSSENCTGAVGVNKQLKIRHQGRKNKPRHIMFRQNSSDPNSISSQFFKPLTSKERLLAAKTRLFLLRNFDKLQRKLKLNANNGNTNGNGGGVDEDKKRADMILAQLTALKSKGRRVRTRQLAESEDNNLLQTVVSLAQVLQHIFDSLMETKDAQKSTNSVAVASSMKKKFSKTSHGGKTLDFATIKQNIMSGVYSTPQSFDVDVNSLLSDVHMTNSDAKFMEILTETYEKLKFDCLDQLRDVLSFDVDENSFVKTTKKLVFGDDDETPKINSPILVGSYDPDDDSVDVWDEKADYKNPEDDKVRCVCGIFEEDGTMVQCDKCLYWVHGDCMNVNGEANDEFVCDYCKNGRRTWRDVVLSPQPEIRLPHCVYYRSLSCGKLQIRLGQCVYLKRNVDEQHKQLLTDFNRECVRASSKEEKRPTEEPANQFLPSDEPASSSTGNSTYDRSDLRIMRVERLFVGPRGVRFVFGSYFAYPHETFCEPTRRFYKNEVFVTPLYDTWPLQTVVGHCLVLDPQTYCAGRPRYPKYDESDVYVCEYRVDKGQRLFDKSYVKNRYPINTKSYMFRNFDEKLKIIRDYTPFVTKQSKQRTTKTKIGKIARKMQLTGKETQEKTDDKSPSTKIRQNKERRLSKVIKKVVEKLSSKDAVVSSLNE